MGSPVVRPVLGGKTPDATTTQQLPWPTPGAALADVWPVIREPSSASQLAKSMAAPKKRPDKDSPAGLIQRGTLL